jgi:WD40 repeat protein
MTKHLFITTIILFSFLGAFAQEKYRISKDLPSGIYAISENYMVMASANVNNINLHSKMASPVEFSVDPERVLEYPHAKVFDLRITSDYKEKRPAVVAVYLDGTIIHWDIVEKTPVKIVKTEFIPTASKYIYGKGKENFFLTNDGKWAALWNNDKILIIDIENESIISTINKSDLQSVSISPDKNFLYVATTFKPIEKLDLKTGKVISVFVQKGAEAGEEQWFSAGSVLSNDGQYMATLGWYRTKKKEQIDYIEILDTKSGKSVNLISEKMGARNLPVFSPDGKKFAVNYALHTSIISTTSGKQLYQLENAYYPTQFVQEGKGLITSREGNGITLWLNTKGF